MAQYNRYVYVPHGSYQEFRNATLGNGYNVDYYSTRPYGGYGNQCWDFCALLYWQYGLTLVTKAGGGTAADCWNVSRAVNSRLPFTSLEGKENVKRGDILVWNSNAYSSTGHIAFADEDYNGTNNINCLGQNQGQGTMAGSNIKELNFNNFLGIFRNTEWLVSPTPPTPTETKKRFPFVLYSHKKRSGF